MKGYLTFAIVVGWQVISYSQTNTFPTSGSVGIGTTSPASQLQVNTNSGTPVVSVSTSNSIVAGTRGDYAWYNSATSTVATIRAEASDDNVGTHLDFYTRPAGGILTQTVRFASNGNIGVGTTTPAVSFHVKGSDGGSISMQNNAVVTGGNRGDLSWYNSDLSSVSAIRANAHTDNVGTSLSFFTRPVSGVLTESVRINHDGNIGIGTTDPQGYKLAVNGSMIAESVKVKLHGSWPDFVFESRYKLPSLKETEKFIKEKRHLPEIPSAKEVEENGVNLGEMNAKLLQKVEELTLYLIEQSKEIKEQRTMINDLQQEIIQFKFKQ